MNKDFEDALRQRNLMSKEERFIQYAKIVLGVVGLIVLSVIAWKLK